jgi:hypothetical protein
MRTFIDPHHIQMHAFVMRLVLVFQILFLRVLSSKLSRKLAAWLHSRNESSLANNEDDGKDVAGLMRTKSLKSIQSQYDKCVPYYNKKTAESTRDPPDASNVDAMSASSMQGMPADARYLVGHDVSERQVGCIEMSTREDHPLSLDIEKEDSTVMR